jgi:hypothetical protein
MEPLASVAPVSQLERMLESEPKRVRALSDNLGRSAAGV